VLGGIGVPFAPFKNATSEPKIQLLLTLDECVVSDAAILELRSPRMVIDARLAM